MWSRLGFDESGRTRRLKESLKIVGRFDTRLGTVPGAAAANYPGVRLDNNENWKNEDLRRRWW